MQIHLSNEQSAFVQRQIEEGRYTSETDVVQDGIRLLKAEMEWRTTVRQQIEEGLVDAVAGRTVDGPAAIQELIDRSTRDA